MLTDQLYQVKCAKRDGVDPDVIFGLDSKLFMDKEAIPALSSHHDEVETATIIRGGAMEAHPCSHDGPCSHQHDVASDTPTQTTSKTVLTRDELEKALAAVSKESVWRIKGFVQLPSGHHILNWAFGRYDLTPINTDAENDVKFTIMGERGEVKRAAKKFAQAIGATVK
jgi:G3E family GTPase